jgi:nucleoside-diphosphate-sugar epimerase
MSDFRTVDGGTPVCSLDPPDPALHNFTGNIAVTGASGFIGRHLCPILSSLGNNVISLGREDIGSPDLARRFEGVQAVVHLAARVHILRESSASPAEEFRGANVGLVQTTARAARSAGVSRFVFLSSAGVLGSRSPRGGFHDHSSPSPYDLYTSSKLEAEEWLNAELGGKMQLVILRPPLVYGPGARGNFMRLLRFALQGVPLPIGNLREQRSMIGIRNMVDLIRVSTTDPRVKRATLLAADRETISVCELYRTIARLAGHDPWLARAPSSILEWLLGLTGRRSDVARLLDAFLLIPTIAESQFGWTPPYSLEEELQHTVSYELNAVRQKN